jgi:cobalt-zinc-cadmium efflux system membrane fusion protein
MNRGLTCVSGVAILVAGIACRKPPEDKPVPAATTERHSDEKEHESLPRLIRLTPEVVREAKIVTKPAEKRRLAATLEINGQIVADPDHIVLLGARVTGRIVKVLVREGDTVRAGQTIAMVTSAELAKRRAEYAATSAKAVSARRNAERLRSLAKDGLGAEQDAVAAEAEATAIEAERDAVAQAIKGMGAAGHAGGDPSLLAIVSPLGGQLVQRDAVPGQLVEPSHTIATVADLSKIWFQAQLFEKDVAQVHEGGKAEVRLNSYPDRVFGASVARVSSQVDPQTRTLTARLALEHPDAQIRLGLFGIARISLGHADDEAHVVVPLSAVTDLGDQKVVFVRQPDGDFEVHEVRLGASASGDVAVLAGLSVGEQVAIAGVHTLKSVVLKATMEEKE